MSRQEDANGAPHVVPLAVSVQVLSFEPGIYRVSFSPPDRNVARTGSFAGFPCARIDAPPGVRPGRAMVAAQEGWLARPGDAALVQIAQERTPLLLTIYRTAGDTPPSFEVQRLDARAEPARPATATQAPDLPPAGDAVPAEPPVVGAAAPPPGSTASSGPPSPADVAGGTAAAAFVGVAHVQGRGDVPVGADGWIGVPGGGMPVEGFALNVAGVPGLSIAYSGELGPDWSTPWASDGEFCGSRGLALPVLGVVGRLDGASSADFALHRTVRFLGGGEIGPSPADAPLVAPDGAPLEAFRFVLAPRNPAGASAATAGTGPAPAPVPAPTPARRARRRG